MSQSWRLVWRGVRSEVATSRRLRIALWLGLVVIALYAFLLARDFRAAQERQLSDAQARLAHVQRIAAQDNWPDIASQAERQADTLSARVWAAPTRGIAQATLQSWIEAQLREKGIVAARLDVVATETPDERTGLLAVNARLTAPLKPAQLQALLDSLATHSQSLLVDRLDIYNQSENPTFELVVRALFALEAKPGAGA